MPDTRQPDGRAEKRAAYAAQVHALQHVLAQGRYRCSALDLLRADRDSRPSCLHLRGR
ncbi:MAG: hypothetical protein ACPGUV_09610 [Polyangiales bacterium]